MIQEAIDRFPESPKKTLARWLRKTYPEEFTSIETARTSIRYRTNAVGKVSRKKAIGSKSSNIDPFSKLPEQVRWDDTRPRHLRGHKKVGVMSDLHIPYHDKESVRIALQHMKDEGCTAIVLLGDVLDFFACSFWEKDPRRRNLGQEIEAGRQFFEALREGFPDAQIMYKLGNHEERWERYMFSQAPVLIGVPDFEIEHIYNLRELNIETLDRMRHIVVSGLNLIHGHEYKGGMTNPVNPARGLYLRSGTSAICGHFHQSSFHQQSDMNGSVTGCWSLGCLCDLKPRYMPYNKWAHGFAIIDTDDKVFGVQNKMIVNGQVV